MLQDLKILSSSDLVEILMKHTEYYMTLCTIGGDAGKRKIVGDYIDTLIEEIKTRDGFEAVIMDTNLGEITAE